MRMNSGIINLTFSRSCARTTSDNSNHPFIHVLPISKPFWASTSSSEPLQSHRPHAPRLGRSPSSHPSLHRPVARHGSRNSTPVGWFDAGDWGTMASNRMAKEPKSGLHPNEEVTSNLWRSEDSTGKCWSVPNDRDQRGKSRSLWASGFDNVNAKKKKERDTNPTICTTHGPMSLSGHLGERPSRNLHLAIW